ncbi:hypothetical protein [Cupriavidus basilensis]|uniref:hypothetical protein n=1 Tax=Cupriavidus basilensis TaxID=68895 RepID=UPI0020A65144|nr:hypothetical protein [Cupriavidus basilensis]MCP3024718.1 hypothetical protein [Cupriavidus basilensis]
MSDEARKNVGQTILSATVVSKAGSAVTVTRLDLTDAGKEMLRSKSAGILTKSEKSQQSAHAAKKLAAA